ncbi:MAG: hypothetical protein IJ815_07845, partial [Lachnospiraceae bacterium]|nr:hypothetical protein [Lachnospiraceae bacterium]
MRIANRIKKGSAFLLCAILAFSTVSGSALAEEDAGDEIVVDNLGTQYAQSFNSIDNIDDICVSSMSENEKILEDNISFSMLSNATGEDLTRLDYLKSRFIEKLKDEGLIVIDECDGSSRLITGDPDLMTKLRSCYDSVYKNEVENYLSGTTDVHSLSLNAVVQKTDGTNGYDFLFSKMIPTIDNRKRGYHMFLTKPGTVNYTVFDKEYEAHAGIKAKGETIENLYSRTTSGNKGDKDFEMFPTISYNGSKLNGKSIKKYVLGDEVYNLFREDRYAETSYYYYKSTETSAYKNEDGSFTVFDQLMAPLTAKKERYYFERGNFIPYNKLDGTKIVNYNLYDACGQKLENVPENRYNEPIFGIKENNTNYQFGYYGYGHFFQPIDGEIKNNSGEYEHMVFDFAGDDDLLIYIDGTLVLDLGGIHDTQSGSIDFATGVVKYTDTATGQAAKWKTTSIYEQYEKAGTLDRTQWTDDHTRFKDGTEHLIQMFY